MRNSKTDSKYKYSNKYDYSVYPFLRRSVIFENITDDTIDNEFNQSVK